MHNSKHALHEFPQKLHHNYPQYHIKELDRQRITRTDIEPFIEKFKDVSGFEVFTAGESVEGREISLVRVGKGARKVLLWSQMHGDESTATRALLEMCRFFSLKDELYAEKQQILRETTLLLVPMLNPDGAEAFQRQNALGIDLNRDAQRLEAPEARILKRLRDEYEPEFGFNLHDQSIYYNVKGTGKQAAISFLAPPYNENREINEGRREAMQLIASMNGVLQNYIPGHVGRFDDSFEPRAFGDNIQKWGTKTILVESGGYPGDPEKKQLVKMNFIALLHALYQIATRKNGWETEEKYYAIPENDQKFFDLLIRNGQVIKNGKVYRVDIGILHNDPASSGNYNGGVIEEIGDLSAFYGFEELDAEGRIFEAGRTAPHLFRYHDAQIDESSLQSISLKSQANFVIRKGEEAVYVVVNGKLKRTNC